MIGSLAINACPICGGADFAQSEILWPELIEDWELAPAEVAYINQQQGLYCRECRASLRSMTLASALREAFGFSGLFRAFCAPDGPAAHLDMLEINEADHLSQYLGALPRHRLVKFPEVDMQRLPFAESVYDVVLHSDTLEHVPNSMSALRECLRVLRPGGRLAFTIPIVIGRLTRKRAGLKNSFHGKEGLSAADYRVETEYGADFWCEVMGAGFAEVRLHALRFPASVAIVARKSCAASFVRPAPV